MGILLSLQHWRLWVKGGNITVVADHESLRTIKAKAEQPNRILRFLDALENYDVQIIYRPGKINVLADYLLRPVSDVSSPESDDKFPAIEEESDVSDLAEIKPIEQPHELSRLDLQAVFERLKLDTPLPARIQQNWVNKHFIIHQDQLCRVINSPELLDPHQTQLA